jgi:predicted ArsR family transcriptional regulator
VAKTAELRNTSVVKKIEDKTRDLVARTILENGPLTAADLAQKLGLTAAGIRRHLDALVDENLLSSKEAYRTFDSTRGRGRPSKVFAVTDLAREKFENTYDDLAASALRFMASVVGPNLVKEFALSRSEDIKKRVSKKFAILRSREKKIDELVSFLSDEGYAATQKQNSAGVELCQHHCPIAHVAAQFPELCEAETKAFSELLGTHVQRLATIAHGDGVCTTFIPTGSIPQRKRVSA